MDQWIREHYKSKGAFGMKTLDLDTRRSASLINRKEQRNTLLQKFRNIPENMSPLMSPAISKLKETQVEKTSVKKTVGGSSKRLEMLKKWKEEKERKKLEAKKKAKPLFKVFHVEHKDNLEDIYTNIKGKSIKSKETPMKSNLPNKFSENKLKKTNIMKSRENIGQFKFNSNGSKEILDSQKKNLTILRSGTDRNVLAGGCENFKTISTSSKIPSDKTVSNSIKQSNKAKLGSRQNKMIKEDKTKNQVGQKTPNKKIVSRNRQNSAKKNSGAVIPMAEQVSVDVKFIEKDEQVTALKKSRRKSGKLNSSQENKPQSKKLELSEDDLNSSNQKKYKSNGANCKNIDGDDIKDKSKSKRKSRRRNKVELLQDEETSISESNYSSTSLGQKPKTTCEDGNVEVDYKEETKTKKIRRTKKNVDETELRQEDSGNSFNIKNTPIRQQTPLERPANTDGSQNELTSSNTSQRNKGNGTSSRKALRKSVRRNSESVEDGILTTPKKESEEEICYVSPFVTVSRGKVAARKEFEQRKSLNGSMFNTSSSDPRSPKAAAGYFTRKLNKEIARIQDLCSTWQSYKDEGNLSEDACGLIDMTIGQSNLLISKKFNQFRGLIERCLAKDELDMKIQCEDLHGFWDMMYKQVSDLDKRFDNLEDMKKNNWLEEAPKIKTPKVAVKGKKKGKGKAKAVPKASSMLKETILAARRNREKQSNSDGDIEILIAAKDKTPRRKSKSKDFKEVSTPGRGILKSSNIKSEKRKTVVFQNLRESMGSGKKSSISPLVIKGTPIPTRKSARLSLNRSKLVFE